MGASSYNFQGVTVDERYGQPDQEPVSGVPAAEQSISLSGVQIKQGAPHIEYLNEINATACRVTIGLPALYSTDTTNGTLNAGPDLRVVVEVQEQRAGAPWVQVVDDLFTGQKCTSRYQRSYAQGSENNTVSYVAGVCKGTEVGATTPIQVRDPRVMAALMRIMPRIEGGGVRICPGTKRRKSLA